MATARAVAAHRRARVVDLVLQGHSYDEIAPLVGYRSKGSVSKAFWKAMDERTVASVDELRTLEVERLDALQASLWEKAMTGDVAAVNAAARIIEKRARLLGLAPKHVDAKVSTVVVDPASLAD